MVCQKTPEENVRVVGWGVSWRWVPKHAARSTAAAAIRCAQRGSQAPGIQPTFVNNTRDIHRRPPIGSNGPQVLRTFEVELKLQFDSDSHRKRRGASLQPPMSLPWWAWAIFTGASFALALRSSLHVATTPENHGTRTNQDRNVAAAVQPPFDLALFRSDNQPEPTSQRAAKPSPSPVPHERPSAKVFRSSWHISDKQALSTCGELSKLLVAQQRLYKDRQPVVWRCGCKVSGLGDRLKGIVAAWMLAMVLGRPFACETFPSFQEHEYGIEPVGADWRVAYAAYIANGAKNRKSVLYRNRAEAVLQQRDQNKDFARPIEITQTTPAKVKLVEEFIDMMKLGLNSKILGTEPFVGDGKNFTNDDATLVSHEWRAVYAHATYCATRSLFRPTKPLTILLDKTLAKAHQVVGDVHNPYILGMHIRFGGKWNDRKRARDSDALRIIECAWNMTQNRIASTQPGAIWTLASDDVERLRKLVMEFASDRTLEKWRAGRIVLATGDGGLVEHVSKSANGTAVDAVRRLWHDWFLISEAHSCALVRSSFPRTACYTSTRRVQNSGLVQQMVTSLDLGRYSRIVPVCDAWALDPSIQ